MFPTNVVAKIETHIPRPMTPPPIYDVKNSVVSDRQQITDTAHALYIRDS
jgi:hypothetical protein